MYTPVVPSVCRSAARLRHEGEDDATHSYSRRARGHLAHRRTPVVNGRRVRPEWAAVHRERRMAPLQRRSEGHAILATRPDRRVQLQPARGRVAVQDRQLRPVPRVQARGDAAHGERRALHDRWHTAIGHRPRREDGRADLVAQLPRGEAGRQFTTAAVGPRRLATGPMAEATSASSMSRPAIVSSR